MTTWKVLSKLRSLLLVVSLIATILFFQAGKSEAIGNASNGEQYYQVCATCHGRQAEGIHALSAPNLVDQYDWYLIRQLQNFKRGIRGSHPNDVYGQNMQTMAGVLPDDQAIEDVVAYIKSLQ